MRKYRRIKSKVPHPVKEEIAIMPGAAIANGTWDGFGKSLCVSVSEGSDVFEESKETEETEDDK